MLLFDGLHLAEVDVRMLVDRHAPRVYAIGDVGHRHMLVLVLRRWLLPVRLLVGLLLGVQCLRAQAHGLHRLGPGVIVRQRLRTIAIGLLKRLSGRRGCAGGLMRLRIVGGIRRGGLLGGIG